MSKKNEILQLKIPSAEDIKLATKIYQVESYIIDEIKEKGEISQFKEDVLYIIHNLLERQLNKQEQTACEIVLKNREATLQKEKEQYLQNKLEQLETKNKKLIEKLEEDIKNSERGKDTNILLIKEYYKNKEEYAQEILSILKGEKIE